MRQRQWFLSILLFAVSISFLVFSKNLFQQQPLVQRTQLALPSVSVPQCNVILLANKDYYPVLKQHFQQAQKSIVGTVYVFKTSLYRGNEPSELLRELVAASKRRVNVDLVMDVSGDDRDTRESNIRTGEMLKKAGCKVHYDTVNVSTHSKAFVIDDRYCFVGSHNLTHSAMSINEELSLYIDSPDMAHKITDFIHQIPLSSDPLQEATHLKRGAPAETIE